MDDYMDISNVYIDLCVYVFTSCYVVKCYEYLDLYIWYECDIDMDMYIVYYIVVLIIWNVIYIEMNTCIHEIWAYSLT